VTYASFSISQRKRSPLGCRGGLRVLEMGVYLCVPDYHNLKLTSKARARFRNSHSFRQNCDFVYFRPKMKSYIKTINVKQVKFCHSNITKLQKRSRDGMWLNDTQKYCTSLCNCTALTRGDLNPQSPLWNRPQFYLCCVTRKTSTHIVAALSTTGKSSRKQNHFVGELSSGAGVELDPRQRDGTRVAD